jgi:hypothetical protein
MRWCINAGLMHHPIVSPLSHARPAYFSVGISSAKGELQEHVMRIL